MGFQSFLIVILFSVAHAKSGCPTSRCDANGVAIQPPFWLQGQTPLNCMSPGFNLSCNTKNISILNLPHDEEFYVSSIYYSEKRVMLYDPNNCLPRRLLHLNLSSSPFKAVSYQKYTFFRCPKGQAVQYGATIIDCMSNTTTDIIAARDDLDPLFLMFCDKIASIPVPVSSGYNDLPDELELTWNDKDCKDCRSECASAPQNSHTDHVICCSVGPGYTFTDIHHILLHVHGGARQLSVSDHRYKPKPKSNWWQGCCIPWPRQIHNRDLQKDNSW
ncbi:putative RING-H2 finger protein ATL21A isoform X2 [Andrographis paniculata]|uniref:putative RING-H2 finger protein ATL21A isoform X2 n=1 Tax=Andrographis paniculata TaxID=175694 RepID=UPI0021E881D7|nr:putative RING-H2 finger protein ATL21A isoform X2 [Andrographis paniculata]